MKQIAIILGIFALFCFATAVFIKILGVIQTNKLRRSPKLGDDVYFYIGEIRHRGVIIATHETHHVTVRCYDTPDEGTHYVSVKNLYR